MSEDIDNILNTDGWIQTKNIDGQIKLGVCNGDLTCAENEYILIQDANNEEIEFKNDSQHKFNLVELFISDILRSTKDSYYFRFNKLMFGSVCICGMVTAVHAFGNKQCLVVDDGTSCIKCLMEENFREEERQEFSGRLQELYQALRENPGSNLLQAAIMMQRSTKKIMDKLPVLKNIKFGDQVKIIGRLAEYNKRKYVFVQKILMLEDDGELTHYRESLLNLYENVY